MTSLDELSLPSSFLSRLFSTKSRGQCQAFQNLFVDTMDGNYPIPAGQKVPPGDPNGVKGQTPIPQSRLQSLFYMLPSKLNYAFIGVDKDVNSMKGKFFNLGLTDIENPAAGGSNSDVMKNLDLWNRIGMTIDLLKEKPVQREFAKVQSAIY